MRAPANLNQCGICKEWFPDTEWRDAQGCPDRKGRPNHEYNRCLSKEGVEPTTVVSRAQVLREVKKAVSGLALEGLELMWRDLEKSDLHRIEDDVELADDCFIDFGCEVAGGLQDLARLRFGGHHSLFASVVLWLVPLVFNSGVKRGVGLRSRLEKDLERLLVEEKEQKKALTPRAIVADLMEET